MLKVFALLVTAAFARNFLPTGDAEIDAFYVNARQADNNISCCGVADAYWADDFDATPDGQYVAIITDDRDVPNRAPIPVGTRVIIPSEKLNKTPRNPTGHGIVFIGYGGIVYCYFPPSQL